MPSGAEFSAQVAAYLGTPYVYGGASPSGFDCSGLVEYVLDKMGLQGVPRTSEAQYAWSDRVGYKQLQPGDLVFFNFPGEVSPGHVAVYVGNNTVIQAPAPGQNVERASFKPKPAGSSEWGGTIVGYGRVPGLSYGGTTAPAASSSSGSSGAGTSPVSLLGSPVGTTEALVVRLAFAAVGVALVVLALLLLSKATTSRALKVAAEATGAGVLYGRTKAARSSSPARSSSTSRRRTVEPLDRRRPAPRPTSDPATNEIPF